MIYKLSPVFGLVPSSVSVWNDIGMEDVWKVVKEKRITDMRIEWPTENQMRTSSSSLQKNRRNGLLLSGIFAVMDSRRMLCVSYTDPDIQNAFWEEVTQVNEVWNLLVWNFHDEVIFADLNFPGSDMIPALLLSPVFMERGL